MNLPRLTATIHDALITIYDDVEPEDAVEIAECITEAFPEIDFTPASTSFQRPHKES